MSMFGLISKNTTFWKKRIFSKYDYGLGQDISIIKFFVVSDLEALFKLCILDRFGLPLNMGV